MSIDTTESFEEQIAACTSAEDVHQVCLHFEEKRGTLTRDRDGSIHLASEAASAATTVQPHPALAVREDHLRERVLYLSGNSRIVITATTQTELDETETRLRAAFAGQQ
jgi:hypothetical protein